VASQKIQKVGKGLGWPSNGHPAGKALLTRGPPGNYRVIPCKVTHPSARDHRTGGPCKIFTDSGRQCKGLARNSPRESASCKISSELGRSWQGPCNRSNIPVSILQDLEQAGVITARALQYRGSLGKRYARMYTYQRPPCKVNAYFPPRSPFEFIYLFVHLII
jgi:hypothetical protein